jgi:hypothetical protein
MSDYRLWVSEDRCTLVRVWIELVDMTGAGSGDREILPGATAVEVATREDPSHTWGPPVTLAEEKT